MLKSDFVQSPFVYKEQGHMEITIKPKYKKLITKHEGPRREDIDPTLPQHGAQTPLHRCDSKSRLKIPVDTPERANSKRRDVR